MHALRLFGRRRRYNANPSECIQLVRKLDCPVVKGNHDEQATFPASSERFNELAERAIEWTRERLNEQDREWLRSLPLQRRVHDFTAVHATSIRPGNGATYSIISTPSRVLRISGRPSVFRPHACADVFVRDDGVRRQASEHIRIEPGKKIFSLTRQRGATP